MLLKVRYLLPLNFLIKYIIFNILIKVGSGVVLTIVSDYFRTHSQGNVFSGKISCFFVQALNISLS